LKGDELPKEERPMFAPSEYGRLQQMCALRHDHAAGAGKPWLAATVEATLKRRSNIHTSQAQKACVRRRVEWRCAFRHLMCLLLHWLLSLLPFYAGDFFHNVLQRLSHYQIHPPRIKERGRADMAFFFFMRLHFTSLSHSLIFCIFSLRFWNTLCGVHETVVIEQ